MALPQNVHRFTVDEFLAMPDLPERTELIDGVICDMSPEGPLHARAQALVLRSLFTALPDHEVVAGGSIATTQSYSPIPDVAVYPADYAVREVGTTAFEAKSVLLVVEVGVTTQTKDAQVKLPRYALAQVPEVWLIDPIDSIMIECREPVNDRYQVANKGTWPTMLDEAVASLKERLTP